MYLKRNKLKEYRLKLLKEQNNICPICNLSLKEEDAALDHDHETGHIRKVIHRYTCNPFEGIIIHKYKRSGLKDKIDLITLLENIIKYWKPYLQNLPKPISNFVISKH